ncbi:hypothetical protein PF001_g33036, partial [Phytophthora fragariae]
MWMAVSGSTWVSWAGAWRSSCACSATPAACSPRRRSACRRRASSTAPWRSSSFGSRPPSTWCRRRATRTARGTW